MCRRDLAVPPRCHLFVVVAFRGDGAEFAGTNPSRSGADLRVVIRCESGSRSANDRLVWQQVIVRAVTRRHPLRCLSWDKQKKGD